MAEKKGFDLSALLRDAAQGMEEDRLEYLPFDQIHQDPNNFYSLEGLNELADNISLFGLMDPLRVRPDGAGGYTVTSGHRRRAAIQLLIDSGEEKWKDRTPCIVDRGQGTPEFHELKLIFANANTRQRSSAEQSREAARVEELLYQLKEQGYEFPGRMRDHVAETVQASRTKLARWHAIRANLVPELLALYDQNQINEAQAYALQQMPQEVQSFLARQKNVADRATAYQLEQARKNLDGYLHPSCRCPDGSDCEQTLMRVKQTAMATASWATCPGGCCLKCSRSQTDCKYRCQRAKQQIQADKIEREAKEARERKKKDKILDEHRATLAGKYAALAVLAKDAGMKPEDPLPLAGCRTLADVKQVANSCGRTLGEYEAREDTVFNRYSYSGTLMDIADRLGCSVDFLLERTPEPKVNRGGGSAAPAWRTGTPEADGWYAVKLVFLGKALAAPRCFRWDGSAWMQSDGKADRPIDRAVTVAAWFKLPEEGET